MAAPGLTFTQALRAKYVEAAEEVDVKVGGKKVQLVGMAKAQVSVPWQAEFQSTLWMGGLGPVPMGGGEGITAM